jgi:hypothetical protein
MLQSGSQRDGYVAGKGYCMVNALPRYYHVEPLSSIVCTSLTN